MALINILFMIVYFPLMIGSKQKGRKFDAESKIEIRSISNAPRLPWTAVHLHNQLIGSKVSANTRFLRGASSRLFSSRPRYRLKGLFKLNLLYVLLAALLPAIGQLNQEPGFELEFLNTHYFVLISKT